MTIDQIVQRIRDEVRPDRVARSGNVIWVEWSAPKGHSIRLTLRDETPEVLVPSFLEAIRTLHWRFVEMTTSLEAIGYVSKAIHEYN